MHSQKLIDKLTRMCLLSFSNSICKQTLEAKAKKVNRSSLNFAKYTAKCVCDKLLRRTSADLIGCHSECVHLLQLMPFKMHLNSESSKVWYGAHHLTQLHDKYSCKNYCLYIYTWEREKRIYNQQRHNSTV